MRYRRSDPGQSFEEYLKNPCISNRGFIYEQHLKEYLSNPGLSLNAIADMLDVEANTVGQYAKKNGIDIKKRRKASYYSCGVDKSEEKTDYHDYLYKKNYRIETADNCWIGVLLPEMAGSYLWDINMCQKKEYLPKDYKEEIIISIYRKFWNLLEKEEIYSSYDRWR